LFIAIMTAQQVNLAGSGVVPAEALAGGIRAAFLAGAIGGVVAVACAFFIRKPDAPAVPAAH
jgi:DHA2 family lincomycin resistance protein-like MFS transporter